MALSKGVFSSASFFIFDSSLALTRTSYMNSQTGSQTAYALYGDPPRRVSLEWVENMFADRTRERAQAVYDREERMARGFVGKNAGPDPIYDSNPSLAVTELQNPPIENGMMDCFEKLKRMLRSGGPMQVPHTRVLSEVCINSLSKKDRYLLVNSNRFQRSSKDSSSSYMSTIAIKFSRNLLLSSNTATLRNQRLFQKRCVPLVTT